MSQYTHAPTHGADSAVLKKVFLANSYTQVENIYVNPGESQAVVAKIMALTRENAVFNKQKPYKRPLPTLPPGMPPRPVPK